MAATDLHYLTDNIGSMCSSRSATVRLADAGGGTSGGLAAAARAGRFLAREHTAAQERAFQATGSRARRRHRTRRPHPRRTARRTPFRRP